MTSLFKTPRITQQVVKALDPTPPPTIDDAAVQKNESDRLRRRRGAQSTYYTGPMGLAVPAQNVQTKTLTGQ